MITIKQVAVLAGVSKATVSRVLNNTGYVNEATRKKVEAVIKECNYAPSASAVNLSRRETNTIGVILPDITNTFFGGLISGITEAVEDKDFSLFYCDTANSFEREIRAMKALKQQRVRGLIITSAAKYPDPNEQKKLREMLDDLGVPVVIADREVQNSKWDGVFYENFSSAYAATTELIKAGNKKIGIITGDFNLKLSIERFEGYKQALIDNNIEIEEKYIYEGDFSTELAYKLSTEMFKSGDMPDGILTCNNTTTLGFIKAVSESEFVLGKDVAAVGIDNVPTLDYLGYPFSYVTRDIPDMGKIAAKLLLERIENPNGERHLCLIPYRLVLKGSEKNINV